MDKQTAKNKLRELRDSLSEVLEGKQYQSAEEIKEQSAEAIQQARDAGKQLKKSLIEKIKDLPVVQKVTELGTAGSVAVSTAAVAQTTVAVDQTEVFVASVANDVVEQRIEAPFIVDAFIDFHVLNDWGQVVMAEKVEAAQSFVEKAEAIAAPSPEQSGSLGGEDPKPSSPGTSPNTSGGSDDQKQAESKSEQQSEEGAKAEEKDSSKSDSENNEQKQPQEQKAEHKEKSQEESPSSEPSQEPTDVKPPRIETPDFDNDLKPHSQVSPTM
jgi:hypothetical protein